MAEAFAVYSADDNSLRFYKRDTVPTAGSTFEGKTATAVYTGVENVNYSSTSVPWVDYISNITTVTVVDTISPISTRWWFHNCKALSAINLEKLDTSNVTTMFRMFSSCHSLTRLDLRNFNTSKVTLMSYMFYECWSLTHLDLTSFDTSNVTSMRGMFQSCDSVKLSTLDLTSFNTANVTNTNDMFTSTSFKTIYVSDKWNMSAVTTSTDMFAYSYGLVGDIAYEEGNDDVTYATTEGGYLTYRKYVPSELRDDFLVRGETLYEIADAIREKTESTDAIAVTDMASKIAGIEIGVVLPTLTNPATAEDLPYQKQAIDGEGNLIVGTTSEISSGSSGGIAATDLIQPSQKNSYYIAHSFVANESKFVRAGANLSFDVLGSMYGDATAADVAAGKTFTSAAGVTVAGTATIGMGTVKINFGYANTTYPGYYFDANGNPQRVTANGTTVDALGGFAYSSYHSCYVLSGDGIKNGQLYLFKTDGGVIGVGCFAGNTQVMVSLDGKTKSIKELQAGDEVVSYNLDTGDNYLARVTRLVVNEYSTDMVKVTLVNGTVLEMTAVHPVYTRDGFKSVEPWGDYGELVVGDEVKTNTDWSGVVSIERCTLDEPIKTYTLGVVDYGEDPDVDTYDNFYANGVVVHNKGI